MYECSTDEDHHHHKEPRSFKSSSRLKILIGRTIAKMWAASPPLMLHIGHFFSTTFFNIISFGLARDFCTDEFEIKKSSKSLLLFNEMMTVDHDKRI